MPRGILASSLADRIGFFLGTHGPSITMDTACSGSLTALSTAAAYLRKGDCDTALVVTVSVRYVHRHILALQVRRRVPDRRAWSQLRTAS
jgi:acyl transferase domain-containing protein